MSRYQNRPPRPFGTTPVPPLEVIELRGRRELAGEPLPPPVELVPAGSLEVIELLPSPPRPLLPTAAELAALPADARAALVGRYERMAGATRPELSDAERVRQAAFRMVETATHREPVGRRLKRLRGHFDAVVADCRPAASPDPGITAPPSASPAPPPA